MNIIIATTNPIYKPLIKELGNKYNVFSITKKEELNINHISQIKPDYIFFPHWSHLIKPIIFNSFKCIVFHMTDLPYGRGGSPLQNLIVRGHTKTKISAINVVDQIDAGDIYLKRDLSLEGTAKEIFLRARLIIKEMIVGISNNNPTPVQQQGEIVHFKRRKPSESNIASLKDLESVYNYIRMLDCEGYPTAFFENDSFKFEFSSATLNNDNITANIKITKKPL